MDRERERRFGPNSAGTERRESDYSRRRGLEGAEVDGRSKRGRGSVSGGMFKFEEETAETRADRVERERESARWG